MKRKLTALLLLLALLLSLTACGDAVQTIDAVQQAAQTVQELADAQEEETPAIEEDGRTYTECDIDTLGASKRGAKRIVFSNDGLIYYTEDHYETFEPLYGEES